MKRKLFSYSYQGFSHISKEENPENKGIKFPCQDRCFAGSFPSNIITHNTNLSLYVKNKNCENSSIILPVIEKPHQNCFSVIALADGHGGKAYYKSEKGAEFAVQVAIELLSESIDKIAISLSDEDYGKINKSLSKSFHKRWLKKILEDLYSTNYLELQSNISALETQDKEAFTIYTNDLQKAYETAEKFKGLTRSITDSNDESIEIDNVINEFNNLSIKSIYGCTLAVYFELTDKPLWYGFKIGDSDIFASFDKEFVKPIKDDPKCFLNETTSLCNTDAVESFFFPEKEYLNKKPHSVICSSDGIADSFENEEYLKKFYDNVVVLFNEEEEGDELNTLKEIEDSLPSLSKDGSCDDVSIAGFISYDDSKAAKERRKVQICSKIKILINLSKFEEARTCLKPYFVTNDCIYKILFSYVNLKELGKLFENEMFIDFEDKSKQIEEELNKLEKDIPSKYSAYLKKVINLKICLLEIMIKYQKKMYNAIQ